MPAQDFVKAPAPPRVQPQYIGTPWGELLKHDDIRRMSHALEFHRARSGETIFEKGDACKYVYWIVQGAIEITASDEISLAVLPAGQMFGEVALIDGGVRSASARACTDCQLIKLSSFHFEDLRNEDPELALRLALQFARALCTRLRDANVNVDARFFPPPFSE